MDARKRDGCGYVLPAVLLCGLLSGCAKPQEPIGDTQRGEALHAACLGCHGTGPYVAVDRQVKSLPQLKQEVDRWNDYYNPKFNEQEMADVVAYLNANFYKF